MTTVSDLTVGTEPAHTTRKEDSLQVTSLPNRAIAGSAHGNKTANGQSDDRLSKRAMSTRAPNGLMMHSQSPLPSISAISQSTQETAQRARNSNVRLSPMAADLIRRKTGRNVQSTPPPIRSSQSRGILSPAVTAREQYDNVVPVPDLSAVYHHRHDPNGESMQGPFTNEVKEIISEAVDVAVQNVIVEAPKRRRKKKAVLIGISNRADTSVPPSPQHAASVQNWYDVLVRHFGFFSKEIWILTDEMQRGRNGKARLTDASSDRILQAMDWLVSDVCEGDQLFFAFSGDLISEPTRSGMVPSDHPHGNVIWDFQVHNMVQCLDEKMTMMMFFDCPNSYSLMHFPAIYVPFKYKKNQQFEIQRKYTPESWWATAQLSELTPTVLKSAPKRRYASLKEEMTTKRDVYTERLDRYNTSASVAFFGLCPTTYNRLGRFSNVVSADITPLPPGKYVSAVVTAIETLMRQTGFDGVGPITFRSLINETARVASPNGFLNQVPQVCFTNEVDLDKVIPLF